MLRSPVIRLLIVGYGNPLRGDDGLGWRAADYLAGLKEFAEDPFVRIDTVHQLTPEIAEAVAEAGMTLFIDAAARTVGHPPGTLKCQEVRVRGAFPEKLGHHLTPAQVLAYARAIYDRKPRAYVASVVAESFDYGAPLSAAVEAAIPLLAGWAVKKFAGAGAGQTGRLARAVAAVLG